MAFDSFRILPAQNFKGITGKDLVVLNGVAVRCLSLSVEEEKRFTSALIQYRTKEEAEKRRRRAKLIVEEWLKENENEDE